MFKKTNSCRDFSIEKIYVKIKKNSCKALYLKNIIDTSKEFKKIFVQVEKVPPPPGPP
jgi:hypothetical protein